MATLAPERQRSTSAMAISYASWAMASEARSAERPLLALRIDAIHASRAATYCASASSSRARCADGRGGRSPREAVFRVRGAGAFGPAVASGASIGVARRGVSRLLGGRSYARLTQVSCHGGHLGAQQAWPVDVEGHALAVAQGDEKAFARERSLDDIRQLHGHDHLSQVDESARCEVQRTPIPERSVVTGCT